MESVMKSIIDKGRKLKKEIGEMVKKHEYPHGNKNQLLLGYHSIMVEHHTSIHLLIENKLNGSAFALVRALYEPLYRAHWVHGCATDDQIEKIVEGKDVFPKMKCMVEEIDSAYGTGNFWQEIKNNSWSAMNDYTHSGVRQISNRFDNNEVISNYDMGAIIEVLNGTNMALLLMGLFFFHVFMKTDEINQIREMVINYSNTGENA
ncbi:MAG: hypothetical protein AB1427_07950 [Thermodesulfobacteriota bacterium]